MTVQDDVIAILKGWDSVAVNEIEPGVWNISGAYEGVAYSGGTGIDPNTSADPLDMARRMHEMAVRRAREATRPVIDITPPVPRIMQRLYGTTAMTPLPPLPVEPVAVDEPDPVEEEPDGDDTFADPPTHPDPFTLEAQAQRQFEGFFPDEWTTLAQAQGALRRKVEREHTERTQTRSISLQRAVKLARIEKRTDLEEAELAQTEVWANELERNDTARTAKLSDIAALETLDEARTYAGTIAEGWT